MSEPNLLPCPFCGGEAGFEQVFKDPADKRVTWSVGCMETSVDCIGYQMLAHYDRKVDAAEAWNKRAPNKEHCIAFYRWWHNQSGTNTDEGFDSWAKENFDAKAS